MAIPAPVALVTGGARRIGRAIAENLARNGFAVAIHCRDSVAEAQSLRADIVARGGRAAVVQGDLADIASAPRMIAAARDALGPVTLLVNNASTFVPDEMGSLDEDLWQRQFAINVQMPIFLGQAMAAALPMDMRGCIVNLIDQRVWKPTPHYFSYSLTKSALFSATQTMAQALAPRVRVNAVGPGPVLANIHDGEQAFQKEVAATLLQRAPAPSDIADAVLFLARAESVTGQMIAVDSGQHLIWQTPDVPEPA